MRMKTYLTASSTPLWILAGLLSTAGASATERPTIEGTSGGSSAPAMLQLAMIESRARRTSSEYHIDASGRGANPHHDLSLSFTPSGAVVNSGRDAFALRLERFGRGDGKPVRRTPPRIEGSWVEYDRGRGVSEWFVNLPEGVEQGWTVRERPNGAGPLVLELDIGRSPDRADAERLAWSGFVYDGLVAVDARGRELPSRWAHERSRLRIEVDDATAAYPVVLDPWLQADKLTASHRKPIYRYGFALAVDGDTALVGAPGPNGSSSETPGEAYVYVRIGGVWTEQAKLLPSDSMDKDFFGYSVALDGDTALVGAPGATVGGQAFEGAAYVFTRSGGTWSEQAKLSVSPDVVVDPGSAGSAVALEGDTAVIGVPFTGPLGSDDNHGAAYVFTGNSSDWNQIAELVPSDGTGEGLGDWFGSGLALEGDTLLIGAGLADVDGVVNQGAVYVFTRTAGTWNEDQKLTLVDGDTSYELGMRGRIALSGDTALFGVPRGDNQAGAAYVFTRNNGVWSEVAELTASVGEPGDYMGISVALGNDFAVLGAQNYSDEEDKFDGTAYIFVRSDGVWTEQTQLFATDASGPDNPGDFFGASVAADGTTALVGAANADPDGVVNQGAVYTYFNPPLDFGTIEGTVRSLGHCGDEVSGLNGATVEITGAQGIYTYVTGEGGFDAGFFRGFLLEDESPLDITVSAPGHLPATVADIAYSGGDIVVQDFDLILEVPCATADPRPVTAQLTAGETTVETLTLGNLDGAAELAWELSTAVPPTAHSPLDREPRLIEAPERDRIGVTGDLRRDGQSNLEPSVDLASAVGERLPSVRPIDPAGGVACDGAPTLIVHDDGTVENAYSSNPPPTNTQAILVDRFTPSAYPSQFSAVCVAFATGFDGPSQLDFEVVILDDDGPDGGPGTELGAVAARITDLPVWPVSEPTWASVDVSSLGITVESGSVYIGARWPTSEPNVFLAADESPDRPVGFAAGYWWDDATEVWVPIQEAFEVFERYRSLFVRALENPGGCLDPSDVSWLSVAPASGTTPPGGTSEVEVTFDAAGLTPGDYQASLCVGTNDPERPVLAVQVALAVTPAAVQLTFDPLALDFGNVDVGASSPPQTATLHHSGEVAATGLTFNVSDSSFDVDASACGDTLPVGGTCPVTVTFSPTEAGPVEATLEVASDQAVSATLELTGRGVAEATPVALEVDPEPRASDGDDILEPGELVDVAPAWRNDGTVSQSLQGDASDLDGPAGADYTLVMSEADYGLLDAGQTASCRDTGVCYVVGVDNPAVRPAPHWEATFLETLSNDTTQTWSLHIGGSFVDVPPASLFYPSIETLLHGGVTGGCRAGEYCPGEPVSRAQMPVFMLRALEGTDYEPTACAEGELRFDDVPVTNVFCPWIQDLAYRGIVAGCGGGNYCPASAVTRAQMAIFLLKTLEGDAYTPPECTGRFSDVDCPSLFADWIEDLAARAITGGCSETEYCPGDPVSRAQMAVFITRAFGFTLYGP